MCFLLFSFSSAFDFAQAISPLSRDLAFAWLCDAQAGIGASEGFVAFGDNVTKCIYLKCFPSMDAALLSPIGLKLFLQYFVYINDKEGSFEINKRQSRRSNKDKSRGGI